MQDDWRLLDETNKAADSATAHIYENAVVSNERAFRAAHFSRFKQPFKVVDSLSPCFRGDFPESVTADRYVTSE